MPGDDLLYEKVVPEGQGSYCRHCQKQVLQRDLSVLAVQEHAARSSGTQLHILDAFTGCGIRALRYASEVPGVTSVIANDLDQRAVKAVCTNAKHSDVADSILSTTQEPAAGLMQRLHLNFMKPLKSERRFVLCRL